MTILAVTTALLSLPVGVAGVAATATAPHATVTSPTTTSTTLADNTPWVPGPQSGAE